MSLGRCIPDMVKRGEIDPARAKRMKELFDELEGYYRQSMGPDAAAAEASEATLKQLRAEARLKKRQTLLQINRQRDAMKDVARFTGNSRYAAISALIDDDDRAPYRGGNVTTAATRIEFAMHAKVSDFIERHRRDLLGKPRDPEALDDVVRALHGGAVEDARARVAADAIAATFEELRQRFNAAGGNIRKLKGFGMPHRHDPLKLRVAGRDQWIADVMPELDRTAMIDDRTGAPMTDERLSEVLDGVYETIRTNGLTGQPTGAFTGSGKLASRRADHRFLHFKDGDAWLRYDARYGSGDTPFTAIIGHISGMAKDIAMMERLGPNPDATMRLLLDGADKAEAASNKVLVGAVFGTSRERAMTENLWRYVKGESSIPVLPESKAGYYAIRTIQGTRNLLTAAMLGSAQLSAISDVNTAALARGFYGLPESTALTSLLKQLNPASAEDRALAVRLGAGMHDAAQSMTSIARYYGEANGPGWTQVVADSVLRVSGLNAFTQAGQNAFVVDLMGTLGAVRDKTWEELPDTLRTPMERNGIDKFDWTAIRQSEPILSAGVPYIDVQAVRDPKAGDRLMDMALRGRAAAVQETTATTRAMTTFGLRAGTVGGEIARNSLQFKGFALALLMKQARMLSMMPPRAAAMYGARFVIGMTVFGAAAIQLREIAKGRDPRPMDNAEFWGDALFQGGGLGIAGDLIGVFRNDRIDNIGQFIGGPFVSLVNDAQKAVRTSLPGKEREDGTRRDANPGKAAVQLVKRYTPGTSLWYARAAFERIVIDQLDEAVNADYQTGQARQAATLKKNRQGAWWAPGQKYPDRAPNMANGWPSTDVP